MLRVFENNSVTYHEDVDPIYIKFAKIIEEVNKFTEPSMEDLLYTEVKDGCLWLRDVLCIETKCNSSSNYFCFDQHYVGLDFPLSTSIRCLNFIPSNINMAALVYLSCGANLKSDWPLHFPSLKKLACESIEWCDHLEPFEELEALTVEKMERTIETSRYPNLVYFCAEDVIVDFVPPKLKFLQLGDNVKIEIEVGDLEYFSGPFIFDSAIISNGLRSKNNAKKSMSLIEWMSEVEEDAKIVDDESAFIQMAFKNIIIQSINTIEKDDYFYED